MKHINLENLANGAFTAQVNRAIEEVTKNIQDPNTEPGATRKITVTIGFKPNQERNFVATGVQTKTTLAPALGAVTAFSMGKDIATGGRGSSRGQYRSDPGPDVHGGCTAVIHAGRKHHRCGWKGC